MRDVKLLLINVDKVFHFPHFSYFFFQSHVVALPLFLSLPTHVNLSRPAPLRQCGVNSPSGAASHSWCLFFSLLSVFLSFALFSVPLLHWRGQMLAGMIAEPAFLSEYTIFALDHSKRPQTAQVASVVSLSSLPVSPFSSFLLLLLLPRYFLQSWCHWEIGTGL